MSLLLDTHVVLWILDDDGGRLGPDARALLAADSQVFVSAASVWEMAIKSSLGKLSAPDDLPRRIESSGLSWLTVTEKHAWATREVSGLPHRDPFDRLLIAQAGAEHLRLLTADREILGATVTPFVERLDARA